MVLAPGHLGTRTRVGRAPRSSGHPRPRLLAQEASEDERIVIVWSTERRGRTAADIDALLLLLDVGASGRIGEVSAFHFRLGLCLEVQHGRRWDGPTFGLAWPKGDSSEEPRR
jgi:hypothetical protein